VYVASYRRAGNVTTDRVIRNAKIVVPASQADAYADGQTFRNGAELWPCPDDADGNLCRKRNWILDNAPEDDVVLLDDDYKTLGYVERRRYLTLDLDGVDVMLHTGAEMCRDVGTAMWGLNQQFDRRFYREYTPLSFTAPVLGPFQAFARDTLGTLRYDEALWLKEDYDLSLQVAAKFRRLLRLNKYHYIVDHLSRPGGQVTKRTMSEEQRQLEALRAKWGSAVVSWNLDRSINPRVRIPIPGV
jgi:hypothetical protein